MNSELSTVHSSNPVLTAHPPAPALSPKQKLVRFPLVSKFKKPVLAVDASYEMESQVKSRASRRCEPATPPPVGGHGDVAGRQDGGGGPAGTITLESKLNEPLATAPESGPLVAVTVKS
jgi:hypothetical protein